MQESTKSKLTVFSRLWAVSMVLFVALCAVGVIATMNENRDLMGVATVAGALVFVIQVCHVVTSLAVRRWWCVAGSVLGVAVSVFALLCAVVALAAGQYRPPVADDSQQVAVAEPETGDTVTFSFAGADVTSNIVAVMPAMDVRRAVSEWMEESLGVTYGIRYDGDRGDMEEVVAYYGNAYVDKLNAISSEGVTDDAELCYNVEMDKIYETDKVVTYAMTIYIDLGGAHPLTKEMGATFSKADGRRLTWDMVSGEGMTGLKSVVRKMLKDYFNATTDAELMNYVQGAESAAAIPLPKMPPYMTEEGFVVMYQQYEIAAYAAGMPGDTIPYKIMNSYLTDEISKLTER